MSQVFTQASQSVPLLGGGTLTELGMPRTSPELRLSWNLSCPVSGGGTQTAPRRALADPSCEGGW